MTRKNKERSTRRDRLRRREPKPEVPHGSSIENLIVIGASAEGHSALKEVLRELSQDIPAAFIILQHMPSDPSSDLVKFRLKDWLQQATRLPVVQISDRERLRMGVVYVVPPGNMPTSAMKDLPVTFCLRLSDIGLALDLLARRKAMLETGLAVSVRTLKERVALLVRLLGQSTKNPQTYEFLFTELAALKLDLRSIQKLLDLASAGEEERRLGK